MKNFTPCQMIQPINDLASYQAAIQERSHNGFISSSGRKKRNVGSHTKYWENGKTLKIGMYNASDEAIEAVKTAASEWLPYVNLKFEFVRGETGDIRIFLNPPTGIQSSAVGTDALIDDIGGTDEERRGPSMYLNWIPGDSRFEYAVIHEFGHALGAEHAHQHPDSEIPWNVQGTYEHCARHFGWSKEAVDRNILPLPRSDQYTYRPYDGDSVMHYTVLPEWTFGGWSQTETHAISDGDIAMMREAYPKN
jgi:hypothetical protein